MTDWPCALYLEKGHLFQGLGFGAQCSSGGEVVFNTGMTGYQEIFTDPSYYKQIVTLTYPHLGNTGINPDDVESDRLHLSAVVAREYVSRPSNWRSTMPLHTYLSEAGIPGISEIDTRELTRTLRDEGAQRGVVFPTLGVTDVVKRAKELLEEVPSMEGLELVSVVSCKQKYEFAPEIPSPKGTFVVVDYGVKRNILRNIKKRGYRAWVVPYNTSFEDILALKPAAVMLANGPGDPGEVDAFVIDQIRKMIGKVPLFAICMGHQLLARALGVSTFKLKFGHHGINHPVKDMRTGEILITSQNHGFAVNREELEKKNDITLSHLNLNDMTVQGFTSEKLKLLSAQFHPEAGPGPSDGSSLFDNFVKGFLE